MSCEVKTFGFITDLEKVRQLLGFSLDPTWLNAIFYAVSPTGDTIAFAHGAKLIILSSDWTHNHKILNYTIAWEGELDDPNEIITTIICLPIYDMNPRTGWTCIAVGTASGNVIFFTDSGTQILSQKWHSEAIHFIKAQSGGDINEEIHIGYISCICILQGNQLFQVLKGLKQQITYDNSSINATNISKFPETISCRKWEYRCKTGNINDSVVVGNQIPAAFDYLVEQTIEKGYFAKYRNSPPQSSLVIGVGERPYTGFYYANEGFIQADFGDVAKAVATKVISSLPGWFFKSPNNTQSNDKLEIPAMPMICNFGICDIQREALNIWLAPGHKLAVISDRLGRIILIDCYRGIALRMWKGYRDAQCAFIKVKEPSKSKNDTNRRKALFLAIYTSNNACLDIWALQQGPKVASFAVSKNGQLLYSPHYLMNTKNGINVKYTHYMGIFLDPDDSTLKEIIVPFHCALSDSNSKTAKDIHLLRKIKLFLYKEKKIDIILKELETSCLEFQTYEIKLKFLEMLTKHKNLQPKMLEKALEIFKSQLNKNDNIENSQEYIQFYNLVDKYQALLQFFLYVTNETDLEKEIEISEKFCLDVNDIETIQKFIDLIQDKEKPTKCIKVTFGDATKTDNNFVEYLAAFILDTSDIYLNLTKATTFGNIGKTIFEYYVEKGHCTENFTKHAEISQIKSEDLLKLFLYYWLDQPFNYTKSENIIDTMVRIASIIEHICNLSSKELLCDYNEVSSWWQMVREILLESQSALQALIIGIICRAITLKYQKCENAQDSIAAEEVWEEVSQEAAEWSLLICKLDDIALLGAILSSPKTIKGSVMPNVMYEQPECSLKNILYGGKGIVAELIGKWLVKKGIHPKNLLTKNEKFEKDENDLFFKEFKNLQKHFPFSTQSGILLCYITWEYMGIWSKNLESLDFFKASLLSLETFESNDYAIKHGICALIWNAHLKIPFKATTTAINQIGKLPSEKLCQEEIGLSDSLIAEFLEYCLKFFDNFLKSINYNKYELKFEEILQDGETPLILLALQQNHAIKQILELHIQLTKVLHLIAYFSLKLPKPLNYLFDPVANKTFFIDFNKELKYEIPPADIVLKKQRENFICQAISASMDLIREDLERLYVLEHAVYIEKIQNLAEMWDIDKEILKKHQIIEMYAHGWDTYAAELLNDINYNEDIGKFLLEVAGKRLILYARNNGVTWARIISTGAFLTDYLDLLKIKTSGVQIAQSSEDIDLQHLSDLAGKAFQCLTSNNSKYLKIAGQMFDACEILKEYQEESDMK